MSILCCTAFTNHDLFLTDLMCMILQRIRDPTPPNSNNTGCSSFPLATARDLKGGAASALLT